GADRWTMPATSQPRARALAKNTTSMNISARTSPALVESARSASARTSCVPKPPAERLAKKRFKRRFGNPRAKLPARLARGSRRLVPARQTTAIAALAHASVLAEPVDLTKETKKTSLSARNALPARTVRRSLVRHSESSLFTTDSATKSSPVKPAEAAVAADRKWLYWSSTPLPPDRGCDSTLPGWRSPCGRYVGL